MPAKGSLHLGRLQPIQWVEMVVALRRIVDRAVLPPSAGHKKAVMEAQSVILRVPVVAAAEPMAARAAVLTLPQGQPGPPRLVATPGRQASLLYLVVPGPMGTVPAQIPTAAPFLYLVDFLELPPLPETLLWLVIAVELAGAA